MKTDEVFLLNESVELQIEMNGMPQIFPSRVVDLPKEGVVVTAPVDGDSVLEVEVGSTVLVYANRKQTVYAFQGRVAAQELLPLPRVHLNVVAGPERSERRGFVRVPVLVHPVRLVLFDAAGAVAAEHAATMVDISGRGCGLQCSGAEVACGGRGEVSFTLPEVGSFHTEVTVARQHEEASESGSVQRIGCHFSALGEEDYERIVRFVWQQQVSLRRRGLL